MTATNEIILNKKISMERYVQQIRAYYAIDSGLPFPADFLKQNAIAMILPSHWSSPVWHCGRWIDPGISWRAYNADLNYPLPQLSDA